MKIFVTTTIKIVFLFFAFLSPLKAQDFLLPSALPPGNLPVTSVPQFVVISFEQNGYSGLLGSGGTGGLTWLNTFSKDLKNPIGCGNIACFDGKPVRFQLFPVAHFLNQGGADHDSISFVKTALNQMVTSGFEIGCFGYKFPHGATFTGTQWYNEIQKSLYQFIKPFNAVEDPMNPDTSSGIGLQRESIKGFRAPYLEVNDSLFNVLKDNGFQYDCSIEEGYQPDQDGTNFLWPYTLDQGSPCVSYRAANHEIENLKGIEGVWELPVYVFIIPPDDKCMAYGCTPRLRYRIHYQLGDFFDTISGKLSGYDYALLNAKINKQEYLAILKYNLDIRLQGNRCPFTIATNSDIFSSKFQSNFNITFEEAQDVLEEFVQYALLKPEVRLVTPSDLITWMQNPVQMDCGDQLAASIEPPGGLAPHQVPQFVTLGFDDNGYSGLLGSGGEGGILWWYNFSLALKNPSGAGNKFNFDNTSVRAAFYSVGKYTLEQTPYNDEVVFVKRGLRSLFSSGNEIGNHTFSHGHGFTYNDKKWDTELQNCSDRLLMPFDTTEDTQLPNPEYGIGLPKDQLYGFRSPFLNYSNSLFYSLRRNGYVYDCSIEEGLEPSQDGTNNYWPYTLHQGSPAHDYSVSLNKPYRTEFKGVSGLWEVPPSVFIIPPDALCTQYGCEPGLRSRIDANLGDRTFFDPEVGKLSAMDYAILHQNTTGEEFLATMKYNLDLRLNGNRSPLNITLHSDIYSSKYTPPFSANYLACQKALEDFILYALGKPEVRIVRPIDLIQWMKNPKPLEKTSEMSNQRSQKFGVEIYTIQKNNLILYADQAVPVKISIFSIDGRVGEVLQFNLTPGYNNLVMKSLNIGGFCLVCVNEKNGKLITKKIVMLQP